MKKIHQRKAGMSTDLSKKVAQAPHAEQEHSAEVERVLEHVSSPYRWELLETPGDHAKTSQPKKYPEQKLGGK